MFFGSISWAMLSPCTGTGLTSTSPLILGIVAL
jgi:hypothetical protein